VSQTIRISDRSAELLAQQASHRGMSVEAWVEQLAAEECRNQAVTPRGKAPSAAEGIISLQEFVKPDPEGWTRRDYIDHGRR
jgi:hypothetical protein